jgi:hypothetical protein
VSNNTVIFIVCKNISSKSVQQAWFGGSTHASRPLVVDPCLKFGTAAALLRGKGHCITQWS